MIKAYVLWHRENRELYQEMYVDCSMQKTPMFDTFEQAELFRKTLSCAGFYETILLSMTEGRYHELSRTH